MPTLRSALVLALACAGCTAANAPAPIVRVREPAPVPTDPGPVALRPGDVLAKIAQHIHEVQERLARKRAQGDWVASACESDRLAQLHVTYRAAREHDATLRQALAEGDQEAAARALNLLAVLVRHTDELGEDVCRCSGLAGLGDHPSPRASLKDPFSGG
jgi:hypothetical protein